MLHWLKLILNYDQDLALSWQRQIFVGLPVTKTYTNRTIKISLFNFSMLGYIAPVTISLLHILSIKKFLVQPVSLNTNTRLTSSNIPPRNISDTFTMHYLRTFCRFVLSGLISSTILCNKLVFPTVKHKKYIKLNWAQFPMIGNN